MNLEYASYLNKSILDDLNISYKIENSNIILTPDTIYTLQDFLKLYHNNNLNYELGIKALKDFCLQIKNFQDRGFTFLNFDDFTSYSALFIHAAGLVRSSISGQNPLFLAPS